VIAADSLLVPEAFTHQSQVLPNTNNTFHCLRIPPPLRV
jgi:hypothetical protein